MREISEKLELKQVLWEEWLQISSETYHKLIKSIPSQLQTAIEAKSICLLNIRTIFN